MKKIICIVLVVLSLFLSACGVKPGDKLTKTGRFVLVSGDFLGNPSQYNELISFDRETGVMYLVISYGRQLGITPLLNTDGTPMLYNGGKNEDILPERYN